MKKRLPTDLKILTAIHDRYRAAFVETTPPDATKNIFVPISIEKVADEIGENPYMLFGRLWHDLNGRHGYTLKNGERVVLFTPEVAGLGKDCVNFPLLGGVLAGLQEADRKHRLAINALWISGLSLAVSLAGLFW